MPPQICDVTNFRTKLAHPRGGSNLRGVKALRFSRNEGRYAAAMGLPTLLRYGGTTSLTPSAVDERLEELAIQSSFGSAGGSVTSSINVLTEQLDPALDLWGGMLAEPRFDPDEIEVWRGRC